MPKYKSRINNTHTNKTVKKSQPKKLLKKVTKEVKKTEEKMSTTGDVLSAQPLFTAAVQPQSAREAQLSGGVLRSGGVLPVAGAISVGGLVSEDEINRLTHEDMGHVLTNMDNDQHHLMQGVGGALLGMSHPMARIVRRHISGPFDHPTDVSKVATRDIVKSRSPQELANALHSEAMDMERGMNVGGGLLDSLKGLFKKGIKGARAAIRDPKAALKGAQHIGQRLSGALKKGIQIGKVLAPIIPGVGTVVEAAERIQPAIARGITIAEQLQGVLGGMNEPLVEMP